MRLSKVLLACDVNADYLEFWPSSRRAWEEIVRIEPLLVLVAAHDDVPPELRSDEAVIHFEPVADVHSTLQAQCIRLLYPALLEADGAVLIADIDLFPLNPAYFHDPIAPLDERFFVSYRDNRLDRGEIDVMFNAARPSTWAEVFAITSVEDVRARIAEWGSREYDGRRGWAGWYTDQQMLYARLMSWPRAAERFWMLDDEYCRYNRLDRLDLVRGDGFLLEHQDAIRRMRYTDYNCFVPYREHREINDLVLNLGLEAARGRAAGGTSSPPHTVQRLST